MKLVWHAYGDDGWMDFYIYPTSRGGIDIVVRMSNNGEEDTNDSFAVSPEQTRTLAKWLNENVDNPVKPDFGDCNE